MVKFKNGITRAKQFVMDLKISYKIILFFLVISIFTVITNSGLYQKINMRYVSEKIEQSSYESLGYASANLQVIIDSVNSTSKMIIADSEVQRVLSAGKREVEDEVGINRLLASFTNFTQDISSIYIFDNVGNQYYSESRYIKPITLEKIKSSPWHNPLINNKEDYILRKNGEGLFKKDSQNYISFIRVINNINTQKILGYMIINIGENAFMDRMAKTNIKYGTSFMLIDENGENILENYVNSSILNKVSMDMHLGLEEEFFIKKIEDKNYTIAQMKLDKYNWSLVTISPYEQLSSQSRNIKGFTLLFIIFNGFIIVIGAVFISKLITGPLERLSSSMKNIEFGRLELVEESKGKDEISQLQRVYNIMILQIKNLLVKVREDENIKRKAELKILMSQIKPHFLYNTFESVSSLALYGETQKVYRIIKALGTFYRTSLNNGMDIITVEEEMKTIRSYLTIQKIRYDDMFDVIYDLDSKCSSLRIIKLILQPLVENSIYHGLKPRGKNGIITITTRHLEETLLLSVADNGLGMSRERLEEVKNGKKSGIGIQSTRERIRLFYGEAGEFIIESSLGTGTSIVIKIPVKEVSGHEEAYKSTDN